MSTSKTVTAVTPATASKAATKPAGVTKTAQAPKGSKPENKAIAAQASTPAAKKGVITLAQVVALDSATQSGGFYMSGIEYHTGKKSLTAGKDATGAAIFTVVAGSNLLKRVKDEALLEAVKKAAQKGGQVRGNDFIKAPKGAPTPYAIQFPKGGKKVSQAYFSSLFM
jgi:hypothetical protein